MLVWTLIGCGEPGPIRSEHTTPTSEIGGKVLSQPEIVWSDLTDIFPTTPVAPPVRLSTLVPGTKGADARAALDAAHLAGTRIFVDEHAGKLVATAILDGHPNVGITVITDAEGRALEELQVEVPKDEALPVLAARWGAPTSTEFKAEGQTIYRWSEPGAPWSVELLPPPGDGKKAVIRYHRP